VSGINFEAGDHAIPENPSEIALALRAGKAAWDKFPYLGLRYGERGKRFTNSDSCWLVTLTRMHPEVATKNLEWLRAVLASRGIPTVILEQHLRIIIEELALEFSDQIERRKIFDLFLSRLDYERRSIGSHTVGRLVKKFDQRFSACAGNAVPSAAELIASAWTDERFGICNALASTLGWFLDPERFTCEWIATVASVHDCGRAHRWKTLDLDNAMRTA
jgi:hypothetical protein